MTDLKYPFTEESVRSLKAGDEVLVSGLIFTGRDRLHKQLAETHVSPVDLRNGAIFHCGPVVVEDPSVESGRRIVAAGPTTSIREEPYMPVIIREQGVRIIIGKGGLGAESLKACRDCGCVYLQTIGGAAALIAKTIRTIKGCYFLDRFGVTEAMWALEVVDLPATVAMDSHGTSLFDRIKCASELKLRKLISCR